MEEREQNVDTIRSEWKNIEPGVLPERVTLWSLGIVIGLTVSSATFLRFDINLPTQALVLPSKLSHDAARKLFWALGQYSCDLQEAGLAPRIASIAVSSRPTATDVCERKPNPSDARLASTVSNLVSNRKARRTASDLGYRRPVCVACRLFPGTCTSSVPDQQLDHRSRSGPETLCMTVCVVQLPSRPVVRS